MVAVMKSRFTPDLFEKPKLSRFILAAFKHYWPWALTVLLLRLGTMSTEITWPLFTKFILDELGSYQNVLHVDWHRMGLILTIGFVAWICTDLPDIAARLLSGREKVIIRADMRKVVLHDLYTQSQKFFHDRFAGSISTSMRDLSEAVSDITNDIVTEFIPALILVACLSAIFFSIHPLYVVLIVTWIAIQLSIIFKTQNKTQDNSSAYARERSELFGKIIDSLSNHMAVRSFGMHHNEKRHIEKAELLTIRARVNAVRYTEIIEITTSVVEVCFVFFGFIAVYLYLFTQGKATPGDFIFLIGGIWGVTNSVNQVSQKLLTFYDQVGVAREAIAKILAPHDITDLMNANWLEVTQSTIDVKDLHFSYNAERPILQGVSFTIKSGEKIGIVGYSGAGKSTLVYLLMRFYEATKGEIFIQGQEIRSVTQESLRHNIALIPQDITLFHRSIRDNIGIAREEATVDDIIKAAKLAGAHDFIIALPEGYDTMVGERGIKLSGGQRQRIAIARAFLKAAPILILDEATSALDSVTEQSIQTALDMVMAGRTTIVIAHRLSTLRSMDRILVFDQGHIVEEGSHGQLMELDGHYARMWEMQAGGFLPQKDQTIHATGLSGTA
jgi:ATP-binding cassette subfamily B protein